MNIFTTIIIISFASLGFRAITGKGMILYFLRSPFDKLSKKNADLKEEVNKRVEALGEDHVKMKSIIKISMISATLYLMKPVLLCSTCMASVHTLVWFAILDKQFDSQMILVMLSVAFVNTLLWSCVELVQKATSSFK